MPTCNGCRVRKIKCDGAQPQCGPCARSRHPINCSYERLSTSPAPGSLRKGAACLACRHRKKKCDALRPFCSGCVTSGTQSDCKYDGSDVVFTPVQTAESFSSPARKQHSPSSSREEWRIYTPKESSPTSSPVVPRLPQMPALTQFSSNTNFEDPAFNPRLTFINHHLQFGIYIPEYKQQAILFGHMSGIAIHPALVSLAQLVGLHLHRRRYWGNETTTGHLRQAEEAQLQTCVTFMSSMTPDNASAIDLMKAYEIMAMYYTRLGIPLEGMRWLAHAKKVVETRAIRFVPKYASPSTVAPRSPWQESADDVLERVTVLSQLIFTEVTWKYLNLQPPMSTELERQFRIELPSAYPIVFENPAVLRTRSALFFMDVEQLVSSFNNSSDWSNTAQSLLNDLSGHIASLASFITQSDVLPDRGTSASLRYSAIICLTSLAEFNRFMSTSPFAHVQDFRSACANAVYQIVQVTTALQDDDYHMLDRFIHVCWTKVLNMAAGLCAQGLQNAGASSLKSCIIVLSEAKVRIESIYS